MEIPQLRDLDIVRYAIFLDKKKVGVFLSLSSQMAS